VTITYTANEVVGAFEGVSPDFIGVLYKGEEAVKEFNFSTYLDPIEGTIADGGIKGGISGLEYDTDYTLVITKAQFWNGFTADWTYNYVYSKDVEVKSATINIPAPPAVVLNAPTFNIPEGTQDEPSILPLGETLKVNFTADNLEANGIIADNVKVKVTVLVSGDLPDAVMGMGSTTAHRVMGERYYIPLGETDFPVALKGGYVYQNVAIMTAELVKDTTTLEGVPVEEVVATYAGAPIQHHWVALRPDPEIAYVYTDLTDDMFHNWSTTDATAEITASVPDVANFENNIGKEVGAGGVVYGTGTVYYQSYAQLADYDVMKIERASAEGGTPRLLFGRLTDNGGEYIEINSAESEYVTASEDGLTWIIDLNKIEENKEGLANLNVIKSSWGGPVTITSVQLGKAAYEYVEIALDVERMATQGYTAQTEEVDLTEAKNYLGVEEITYDMLRIVNPDGTEISDYAPFDGWFNAEGVAEKWGANTKVCVKFFQAIPDGKFEICDMNKADEVGATYNVKWALVANDKKVFYNIGVTFIEAPAYKPEIVKTIDIAHVEKAETAYCEEEAAPTFDVAEVCTALGIDDISKAEAYIVNVTTGNFVKNTTDGWRDANGDAAPWGDAANGFCLKLNNPASGEFDYTGAHDANFQIGDTYVAQWGLVANEKAVVLKVTVTFAENPATAITSLSADNADIEAVYTIGGAQLQGLQKGMNIVKYANGTIKKVFVK